MCEEVVLGEGVIVVEEELVISELDGATTFELLLVMQILRLDSQEHDQVTSIVRIFGKET